MKKIVVKVGTFPQLPDELVEKMRLLAAQNYWNKQVWVNGDWSKLAEKPPIDTGKREFMPSIKVK